MADNTARARKELESQRNAIRDHQRKYRDYKDKQDKDFALKTIRNVQNQIAKLKSKHPSLAHDNASEDNWKP